MPEPTRRRALAGGVACLGLALALLLAALAASPPRAASSAAAAKPQRPPLAFDRARAAGIRERTSTWGASVNDFDADGRQDVLLVRHRFARARLYRQGRGGAYREVADGTFAASEGSGVDRHGCDWADVDSNGLDDVYCTLGGGSGDGPAKANELWLQVAPGRFRNRTAGYGAGDPFGRGRHVAFFDFDRDRDPDLYVGNAFPRRDAQGSPNRFFVNEGGESLRAAPEYGLDVELGGRAVQAVDFDEDGWRDLLVCGQEQLFLYRNMRGRSFREVGAERGVRRPCSDALMRDLDDDGDVDLAATSPERLTVSLQRRGGFRRVDYARSVRGARSLAAGRFDAGREPDLYVLQSGLTGQNRPDLLLLGRRGPGYQRLRRLPTTSQGVGDEVVTLDSAATGRDEFLVLNGRGTGRGPVQLIAARR